MTTPLKVLVVDDNPGLRTVCFAVLTSAGYEVAAAEDGFAGLLHLEESLPDLIVCDLHLPRMSGFEFLSIVRRRFPQVRIMAMSGVYLGDSNSGGVLADAFYSKGQSPVTFLATVKMLMQTAPARRSSELAEVWIPLDAKDTSGKPYVVATCPECFRTFPLSMAPAGSPDVLTAACLFCSKPVRYKNDFSRLLTIATDRATSAPPQSDSKVVAKAALEASVGAFEDEIASQVPFI
jgi:CheY-like chemotaxis protein